MDNLKYFLFFILAMGSRVFGKNKIHGYAESQKAKYKKRLNASKKLVSEVAFLKAHMYFKQKYNINLPVDILGMGDVFILDKIKVGDIKRIWDGKIYSLTEVEPYKYLQTGDRMIYEDFMKKHEGMAESYAKKYATQRIDRGEPLWPADRMDKVLDSVKKYGYDPSKMCICVDENNIILDGQHRACCLLYLYGKDYIIEVCRVKFGQ